MLCALFVPRLVRLIELPTIALACLMSFEGGSEAPSMFAVELIDAIMANSQRSGVHVYPLGQHHSADSLQPHRYLTLNGAGACQFAKIVVQR